MLLALTAIILVLLVIFSWHILFPILGGIIILSAAIWGIIIASIVIFCVVMMLLFLFGGIGVFVLAIIFALWTIIAIILFPILLPILLPLFIIFIFILAILRRRQRSKRNIQ